MVFLDHFPHRRKQSSNASKPIIGNFVGVWLLQSSPLSLECFSKRPARQLSQSAQGEDTVRRVTFVQLYSLHIRVRTNPLFIIARLAIVVKCNERVALLNDAHFFPFAAFPGDKKWAFTASDKRYEGKMCLRALDKRRSTHGTSVRRDPFGPGERARGSSSLFSPLLRSPASVERAFARSLPPQREGA